MISLTVFITLQKVFKQHKENYAHGTAVRLRPALMVSNCTHEMHRRFFTLKTLQHLPCDEHQSQRLSLQEHLATRAPYTRCPWSKAKLCRCSWKIPCSRPVTLSPKMWQLSLSCRSSRPSTQGKHRKANCVSTQPAGICWFSTIVTLLSTLCWGPHSNINLGLCSRLKPCPPQVGSAIHLVCVHFPWEFTTLADKEGRKMFCPKEDLCQLCTLQQQPVPARNRLCPALTSKHLDTFAAHLHTQICKPTSWH